MSAVFSSIGFSSLARSVVETFNSKDIAIKKGLTAERIQYFSPISITDTKDYYIDNEPEILFIVEYIVDGVLKGALIVWEKYYDSTHYSVMKKNLFQSQAEFERILFLSQADLKEESKYFLSYIKDILGFKDIDEDNIFIMLDDKIKEDRVYEYQIIASQVPQKAEQIDYRLALRCNDLLNSIEFPSSRGIYSIAKSAMGSRDLAWIIGLVNIGVKFFGNIYAQPYVQDKLLVPRETDDVLSLIKDSISLFGLKDTLKAIIDILGGVSLEIEEVFLDSIDTNRNVFYYAPFKEKFVSATNIVSRYSKTSGELEELRDINFFIFNISNTSSENLMSIEGLSNVFNFINEVILITTHSQQDEGYEILAKTFGKKEVTEQIDVDALKSTPINPNQSDSAVVSKEVKSSNTEEESGNNDSVGVSNFGHLGKIGVR